MKNLILTNGCIGQVLLYKFEHLLYHSYKSKSYHIWLSNELNISPLSTNLTSVYVCTEKICDTYEDNEVQKRFTEHLLSDLRFFNCITVIGVSY